MPTMRVVEVQCADYEHTVGISGKYDGISVQKRTEPTKKMFPLALNHRPFEFIEFSIANYIMLKARGARWLTALPVSPYRAFRHNIIYVLQDSALTRPEDLRRKKVGVPDYSMTAAVWTRGIYLGEYGVAPEEIEWVSKLSQRFPAPEGIKLTLRGEDLEELLERGEIDALLATDLSETAIAHGKFRRLLPNHPSDERAYFRKTGIYPPNHIIVANLDVVKDFDRVASAVFGAFSEAKAKAYQRRLGATLLPWGAHYWDETFSEFGNDPLPYGLTAENSRAIELVSGYLADQGLIPAKLSIDELFEPAVRGFTEV